MRSTARYSRPASSAAAWSGCPSRRIDRPGMRRASGITARPSTLFQPTTRPGPARTATANTVPELPAPAIPSAVPWYCGGYQREASGSATAKDAPATPRTSPSRERAVIGLDAESQATSQSGDHDDLADDAGALRAEPIDEHAEDDAQQRAGEHGQRHHEAFLCRAQAAGPRTSARRARPSITQTMKLMSK